MLGSIQRREVDVRVVSATDRPLQDLVARGDFREDLLYRINLIAIHLPPLRERPDDIPVLASRFLHTAAQVYQRDPLTLSDAAQRWLQAQPWPGNVRQLRQWVERAVVVGTGDRLDVPDFVEAADAPGRGAPSESLPAVGSMTMDEIERGDDRQIAASPRGTSARWPNHWASAVRLCIAIREVRDHGVSLRARTVAYLAILHAIFAGLAVFLFLKNPFWLLAVEVGFAMSLALGIRLARETFRNLGFAAEGLRLIRDEEFTSRFIEVGQPEIDD